VSSKENSVYQAIVTAAISEFPKYGYAGTTIAMIANEAECSRATLYKYFSSKEALFSRMLAELINQRIEPILDGLSAENNLEANLRVVGEKMMEIRLSPEMIGIYRLVIGESENCKVGALLYANSLNLWQARIAALLADKLTCRDINVAVCHLKALMESELLPPLLLGVRSEFNKSDISEAIERAVGIFLAAYCV
jgi:AcrR family transcriptional regulator